MKVFLGGTFDSKWRDELIPMLKCDYFNPVIEDWTPECQAEELRQREECDFCLYVITPAMTDVYAIAEVVDDSNKRPGKTIFCLIPSDGVEMFTEGQLRSLYFVEELIEDNGAMVFSSLIKVADWLEYAYNSGLCEGS